MTQHTAIVYKNKKRFKSFYILKMFFHFVCYEDIRILYDLTLFVRISFVISVEEAKQCRLTIAIITYMYIKGQINEEVSF